MSSEQNFWRKCSACKKPIGLNQKYYICSVSTCQGQRTGYTFCSITCWDSHVPGARHKDAGALERVAPRTPEATSENASPAASGEGPRRIIPSQSSSSSRPAMGSSQVPKDVLIVASKLKDYIRARSDFNTSGSVMDVLSDFVRVHADRAIENARADGRKTVLDRDFQFPR